MNGYFVSFGKPKDCMVCSLRSFGGFSGVLALCFECNTLIHCSCKGNRLKLISISALLFQCLDLNCSPWGVMGGVFVGQVL
jgi:hypothetical protein